MKVFNKILLLITGVLILSSAQAQKMKIQDNPKYGPDSVSRMTCAGNLSSMSEFVKIGVYDYAYTPWKECFINCPGAHKNIYIQGAKILDYKIESAQTDEEKQAYIDTLMLLYDKRVEYFGQEGKVLGMKGADLLSYRPENVEEAYKYLKKSQELEKDKVSESVAVNLNLSSSVLFKNGTIEAEELITNYSNSIEYLQSGKQTSKTPDAIDQIEKIFSESGAANCDALIKIYTPKYEANKENVEELKKITESLEKSQCQESELFAKASETLYALEPSPAAGANLGLVFASKGEYEKAKEYYLKAIELETDAQAKAKDYYQLALISYKTKDYPSVKKYGYSAIESKADYGEAYLLIGNAYAASSQSCGSSSFQKSCVYLVAVDKFIKAKSVDPTVTEKANELINNYSRYFPNNEDAFFEGYTDGKSYTVKCWINETTKMRTIKK